MMPAMKHPIALALLPLAACAPDLPTDGPGVEALTLFRGFEGDAGELSAAATTFDQVLGGLDLEGHARQRLFDAPALTADDLGDAEAAEVDPEDQMRALMVGRARYGLDDELRAQVAENQSCSNARSVTCHERVGVDGDDPACFLAGDCETWRSWNTVRLQTVVDFWLEAPVDFRWTTLEDGRRAVVARTWIERPFDNDNGHRTWTQRFGLDVFVEDPDDDSSTRRAYATWMGPSVNGLTGALLQNSLRRGLDEGFERPDRWLDDGGTCDVDLAACLADSPF